MGNEILGTPTSHRGTTQFDSQVNLTLLRGVNRTVFIVCSAKSGTSRAASNVTFGGQACTKFITENKEEAGEGIQTHSVWALLNVNLPAIGVREASADYGGSANGGHRITCYCVENTVQEIPSNIAKDSAWWAPGTHNTFENNITVADQGDSIFGAYAVWPSGLGAPQDGQTDFGEFGVGNPSHDVSYLHDQSPGAIRQKWISGANREFFAVLLWTLTPLNIPKGGIPIMF